MKSQCQLCTGVDRLEVKHGLASPTTRCNFYIPSTHHRAHPAFIDDKEIDQPKLVYKRQYKYNIRN